MGKQYPYNVPVKSTYGAPMGRANTGAAHDGPVKLTGRQVPSHDGGYDGGGAYWGHGGRGDRLFCFWSADRTIIRYGWAASMQDAKAAILEDFPNAKLAA